MPLTLQHLFPTSSLGFDSIGFLFGCGTSKGAGYPLMGELTKSVYSSLSSAEQQHIVDVFVSESVPYDLVAGQPDIENAIDIVVKHRLQSQKPHLTSLEASIRKHITDTILAVTSPRLDDHLVFLDSLSRIFSGRSSRIWIFTTNYDLLFELAAEKLKIRVLNGFSGIFSRFFDYDSLQLHIGHLSGSSFSPLNQLEIILVKLHGSISWYNSGIDIIETMIPQQAISRTMVLPQKTKIINTLERPYDSIFRYSSQILGTECKYLVSCGFGYRDQHIVDTLILPKLHKRDVRFFALFGEEPTWLSQLTSLVNFNYATPTKFVVDGSTTTEPIDSWRFDKFVKLFP